MGKRPQLLWELLSVLSWPASQPSPSLPPSCSSGAGEQGSTSRPRTFSQDINRSPRLIRAHPMAIHQDLLHKVITHLMTNRNNTTATNLKTAISSSIAQSYRGITWRVS